MYIKEKHNKGITLIALVITIIVLLILAGVSISLVVGNNGVLTQASNAVISNREATAKEKVEMIMAGAEAEYWAEWAKNSSVSKAQFYTAGNLGKYVDSGDSISVEAGEVPGDGNYKVNYNGESYTIDGNGKATKVGGGTGSGSTVSAGETATGGNKTYSDGTDTATIPEGWTVSGITGNAAAGIADETTISTGLVIYDIPSSVDTTAEGFWTATNTTTGNLVVHENYNQFVWIPVSATSASEFVRYDGYSSGSRQNFVSGGSATEPYASGYSTENSEYTNMVNSVIANHGFYVGRYEAGTTAESGTGKRGTVVSRKNAKVYNNIAWNGTSSSDSSATKMSTKTGGAVEVAQGMNTPNVTSTLIYGVQWDAILAWIDPNYKTGTCVTSGDNKSILVDSTNKGNYSGSVANTGSNTNYVMKNIYDMAGNVWEWTMEAYNTDNRVGRGGGYDGTGSGTPVSYRGGDNPLLSYDSIGFRVTLYL